MSAAFAILNQSKMKPAAAAGQSPPTSWAAAAAATPCPHHLPCPTGICILKEFDTGTTTRVYFGLLQGVECPDGDDDKKKKKTPAEDEWYYRVVYDDGDREHLDFDEVRALLDQQATLFAKRLDQVSPTDMMYALQNSGNGGGGGQYDKYMLTMADIYNSYGDAADEEERNPALKKRKREAEAAAAAAAATGATITNPQQQLWMQRQQTYYPYGMPTTAAQPFGFGTTTTPYGAGTMQYYYNQQVTLQAQHTAGGAAKQSATVTTTTPATTTASKSASNGRQKSDGTVVPATSPKRKRDGSYKRPVGRPPQRVSWDGVRGIWVPEGSGAAVAAKITDDDIQAIIESDQDNSDDKEKRKTATASTAATAHKKPQSPPQKIHPSTKAVYRHIQDENWKAVLQAIKDNPNLALSPIVLAEATGGGHTTILHQAMASQKDMTTRVQVMKQIVQATPRAAALKSSDGTLPLHDLLPNECVVTTEVKESIARDLIRAHPEALVEPFGPLERVPLHVVFATDRFSIGFANFLVEQEPKACFIKDSQGWLPAHVACASPRLPPLKLRMLLEVNPRALFEVTLDRETLLTIATKPAYNNRNAALTDEINRQMAKYRNKPLTEYEYQTDVI